MPTIQAGFDLFQTEEAFFPLSSGFGLPADFFQKGSHPFAGIIRFRGVPIRKFEDPRSGKEHKTGTTDTIMQRKQDVTIGSVPGSGTTEIELVALSLKSMEPIQVQTAHGTQKWDVFVSLSRAKPSVGSMTITQSTDRGGTFASEFVVWPIFRFERQSDGEERILDTGAMRLPAEKQALAARVNTLTAADVEWTTTPAAGVLANAALTANFAVAIAVHPPHHVIAAKLA